MSTLSPDALKEKARPFAAMALTLEASTPLGSVSLRRIANLQPGDILDLRIGPQDPIEVRSSTQKLAKGQLAQVDGKYAVRLLGSEPASAR